MHPHFICNIFLSVSFFVLKTTPPFCAALFEDCELELREWQMLTFLGCIIVLKNRKTPTYTSYISTVCMFAKMLSLMLYFTHNPLLGVVFIIFCLLHFIFLPEPSYSGPEYITYFRGPNLEDEIKRDPRITWVIEFYAAWSPNCVSFAPVFSQLSAKYSLANLKFGKIDASRYQQIAERFRVNVSSWSSQLPTVMLFQNGRESDRRPLIDGKGRVVTKYIFSEENVIKSFGLNEVYSQCKANLPKKKKEMLNAPLNEDGDHANGSVKSSSNKKND